MDDIGFIFCTLLRPCTVIRRSYHLSGAFCKSGRSCLCPSSSLWLSCVWLAGLLLGLAASIYFSNAFGSWLPVLYQIYRSAPLKLLLTFLPFLLSAFAVCLSRPGWLFLICGIKAVCFVVCSFVLCLCYGQAGWLARWLFMFSDACTLPLLFLYWMQNLAGNCVFSWQRHVIFLFTIMLFTIIDHRIVTPYAVKFVII